MRLAIISLLFPFFFVMDENLSHDPTTTSTAFRLIFFIVLGSLSIWAHNETVKGVQIEIQNFAGIDSIAGRRFHLFFVSDESAIRVIYEATRSIQRVLYPSNIYPKKPVHRIILQLPRSNQTELVIFNQITPTEFILQLNPEIMYQSNGVLEMISAIRLGVARVWIWDGEGTTPQRFTNGMADYLSSFSDDIERDRVLQLEMREWCGRGMPRIEFAKFLSYCEKLSPGSVARLNRVMRSSWSMEMAAGALSMPAQMICTRNSLEYGDVSVAVPETILRQIF